MSTIVYQQDLQPCNTESYFTLSLKLSSPKNNTISQTCTSNSNNSASFCSWSEIEELTTKRNTLMEKEEQVYIHPLDKMSSFKLSERSLEMCTESLCSETGSCAMEESSLFFPSEERRKPQEKLEKKRKELLIMDYDKFPPPLTTLRGSNPIRVRKYSEEGRLVIEAVRTPPIHSYMQAERIDGRLILSMVSDNYDSEICCSHDDEDGDNDTSGEDEDKSEECINTREDEYLLEEMKGITLEFGVKLGLGNLQRPSRCKEGGQRSKRLLNWEPFWVAT